MKDWERIRASRDDLTDYVVHFTRYRAERSEGRFRHVSARDVLIEILGTGHLRPDYAARSNMYSRTPRATVKGPQTAVCLTEQPLWAAIKSRDALTLPRYSGYGIAYHKYLLYAAGGRPALYALQSCLGRRLRSDEAGWEQGKDIFTGGLPADLQYLWVNYQPDLPGNCDYPIDFTWEREWDQAQGCGPSGPP